MRLRHLTASAVVVEQGETRVLCDPWLLDGAFYGSWAHYPPLQFEPEEYDHVDYVYVSHIHPDHCHLETLSRLDDEIPVLIHDYASDFLRANVERQGFDDVRELPHDERIHLGDDLHLNVLAADDCDPEVCGSYFGCGWWMESATGRTDGSTQIDSMGVFDDGEHVIVNANDCRWPLSRRVCERVDRAYDVDVVLMQYAAANFYPQCMGDYTPQERRDAAEAVIEEMYHDAAAFVNAFEPDYYMPFAGSYTLAGSLSHLNEFTAVPERIDAAGYLDTAGVVECDADPILLNSEEWFDLETGRTSAPYEPVDPDERRRYVERELADRTFPYEEEERPSLAALRDRIPPAYEHLEDKRTTLGYESDTTVLVELVDDAFAAVSLDGSGYEVVSRSEANDADGYVQIRMDPRLLKRVLDGPKYAHYNNAQIGSHVEFRKKPDVYERPLYYCMNFFHA